MAKFYGTISDAGRENIRKRRILNLIVFAVFVVLSMFYYSSAGKNQVTLSVQDDSLRIEVPEKSSYEVKYDEIISLSLQEAPEYGNAVNGGTAGKCNYGRWRNEKWGDYICYTLSGIRNCIVMETTEGKVVFNFESQDATEAFYEAFTKKLNKT